MFYRFPSCPKSISLYLKYLIALLILFAINVSPSKAQGESFWTEQERIPEYADEASEPPYLIVDSNRTVHAFNAQPLNLDDPESSNAIMYRQWTPENGWSFPNDILLDSDGAGLLLVGAVSDQAGRVHLIIQRGGDIYYTKNYLVDAGLSTGWSTPILIAGSTERSRPGVVNVASIATNEDGSEVVVIYGGTQFGNGLYFTSSSDDGNSWSEPYPIYLTGDESIIVTDPELFAGKSGKVHAVWSTFLDDGSAGPGLYTHYDPQARAWIEPTELDATGIRTPSVIEKDGELFVGYYHANGNHNWWRKSGDYGVTWSLPRQMSSLHRGTNGRISFAVDGENILHAFFGQRIDDNNHGMWHKIYSGSTFSNLEAVVRGRQIRDRVGGKGFDPRAARAVIVNGNTVLVTWATDGAGGVNGAWYSYKRLDAPELPSVALESPTITVIGTSVPAEPLATSTSSSEEALPISDADLFKESPRLSQNPQMSIYIGVIPVVLLLTGIIFLYFVFKRKN